MCTTSLAVTEITRDGHKPSPGHRCPRNTNVPQPRPAANGWPGLLRLAGRTRAARYLILLATLIALGGFCDPAWSAGFTVSSQGTAGMAQGNAFVAEANDPSAIFYNPAGINQLTRPEVYGMAMLTYPERTYQGPTSNSQTHHMFVPSGTFYAVYPINPTVTLGLGVFSPFGQQSHWQDSWPGRYLSTYGSLTTYNVNPVVSFRLHEKFSFALGFDAMMSTVKIQRKVALPFGLADGDSRLQGNGTAYGFNLGMLLDVIEGVKAGLSYRYQMEMRYTGTLALPQPSIFGLRYVSVPATANMTFPHLVTLGVSVSNFEPFVINCDVTWSGYSSFDAIDIRTSQPVNFNGVSTKSLHTPRNWHDTWTFRLGTNYRLTERIKLRVGYTYDLSAIPNATFDPQIVAPTQHIFTCGGEVKLDPFTLGIAYNYLLGESRSKNNFITTNGVPATLQANGKYQPSAHALGTSLSYKF
jgi:long-chain fatty acid transport protein